MKIQLTHINIIDDIKEFPWIHYKVSEGKILATNCYIKELEMDPVLNHIGKNVIYKTIY